MANESAEQPTSLENQSAEAAQNDEVTAEDWAGVLMARIKANGEHAKLWKRLAKERHAAWRLCYEAMISLQSEVMRLALLRTEPTRVEEPEGGSLASTPEGLLPWDDEDQWLANGEYEAGEHLRARVKDLESQILGWVLSSDRQPVIPGKYVVVSRMTPSPCMLMFGGTLNRHWEAVTQWYGPLPAPRG